MRARQNKNGRKKKGNKTGKRNNQNLFLNPFNMNQGQLTRIPQNRDGAITSMSSMKVYKLVRTTGLDHRTFVPGTVGAISVQLNQVLTADFSALYDEYRICAVTWKIWPDLTTVDSAEQISGLPSDPGMFEMVVDYDDANAPIATELYEYQTYRNFRFLGRNQPITSTIVPRVSAQFYETAVTTQYGSKAKQWLDLASAAVPHYGWKYHFSSSIPDVEHLFGYYEQFVFYLEFRGVR